MNALDRYLLLSPLIRMSVEWSILVTVGIAGIVFSWGWIPGYPVSNVAGVILLAGGWMLHGRCHRYHGQGHERSSAITHLVTCGIYARIRHPMYLTLILMQFGMVLAWGVLWMLLPATAWAMLTVLTALKEEDYLLQRFGAQYRDYMRRVPYRFIPGLI